MTEHSEKKRVDLSVTQVVAGSLAAVTSAVAASRLGVAGTLGGAAVGSVVATVGAAYYEHYLDRTRQRLRSAAVRRPTRDGRPTPEPPVLSVPASGTLPPTADGNEWWRRAGWAALGLSAVVAFGIGVLVLTGYEWAAGGPVSGNGGGTTLSRVVSAASDNTTSREKTTEQNATPSPSPTDQESTPSPAVTHKTITSTPEATQPTQPTQPTTTPEATVPARPPAQTPAPAQ